VDDSRDTDQLAPPFAEEAPKVSRPTVARNPRHNRMQNGPDEAGAVALIEDCAQRVSRWSVCLRQKGQNFFICMRSGSLRRFFLVM
jgi:hypothetical protein